MGSFEVLLPSSAQDPVVRGLSNSSSSGGCEESEMKFAQPAMMADAFSMQDLGGYVLQNQALRTVLQVVGSLAEVLPSRETARRRGTALESRLHFTRLRCSLVIAGRVPARLACKLGMAGFVVDSPV